MLLYLELMCRHLMSIIFETEGVLERIVSEVSSSYKTINHHSYAVEANNFIYYKNV